MRSLRIILFATLWAVFLCGGCRETRLVPATQIMVVVDADSIVRGRTTELVVTVEGGADPDRTINTPRFTAPVDWPVRVAVVPRDDDVTRTLRIEAAAVEGDTTFVSQLALTSFLQDRLLELPLFLSASCVGMECPAGQTCEDGTCRTATVDPMTLDPFEPPDGGLDSGPDAAPDTPVPDGALDDARLASLTLSAGTETIMPPFSPDRTSYAAEVPFLHHTLHVTATPVDPGATVTVNGAPVDASFRSQPIALRTFAPPTNTVTIRVVSGGTSSSTTLQLTRNATMGHMATLEPSALLAADVFGWSISHASETIVVGAPRAEQGAENAGTAYVFTGGGGAWSEVQQMTSPSVMANGHFGGSVALTPDGLTLFVSQGQYGTGVLYKYTRASETATFTLVEESSPQSGMGVSLAIDGATLVAGAAATHQAHVLSVDSLMMRTTISGEDGSGMGSDVALVENTLVAGASQYEGSRGAVYTSTFTTPMWSALEPLEGTHPTGRFGWSLDLRGSWAGEPMLLAVGAYATRTNDGQVHVFHRMSDSWVPLASQPTPAGAAGSVLGWSIAVSGDVVAAAAPGHTSSAGAVFLFVLDEGGGWTNGPVVVAPDGESGDKFGGGWSNGIVISGDLLIVGAPGAGPRLTETFPVALEALGAGRVYVFQ